MEAGQKILIGAASTLVLCLGIYLILFEIRIVSNMFDVVQNQMKDEELYQQYYSNDNEKVTYPELVATLLNDLEYDIVIDGELFKGNDHSVDKITEYGLEEDDYRKEYQYDESGNIILILYTSKD